MNLRVKLFIRLFVATFLAWAVPHTIYRLVQLRMGTISITFDVSALFILGLILFLVSGGMLGFQVAVMQWMALRPYIASSWLWFVGIVLCWMIGDVFRGFLTFWLVSWSGLYITVFIVVIYAALTGILVGMVQQALLQKRTGIRGWWFVSGLVSTFCATVMNLGNNTFGEGVLLMDPIQAAFIGATMMAVLASLPALLLKPSDAPGSTAPAREAQIENPLVKEV